MTQSTLVDPQEPGRITGYKKQKQADLDLVNEIKDLENSLGDLVEKVRGHEGVNSRMVRLSVTAFQTGFMWLVRAVFQPESRLSND